MITNDLLDYIPLKRTFAHKDTQRLAKILVEIHDANTSKKNSSSKKLLEHANFKKRKKCSKIFWDEEWFVVKLLFDIHFIKLLTKEIKNLR